MLDALSAQIAKSLVDSTLSKASRWASHRIHLPLPYPGVMKYDHFPWLPEIMDVTEGIVSIRKGSQLGLSVAAMAKALHIVCEVSDDLMYVLPTASLVGDFSRGRLQPILNNSPELCDLWSEANVGFRQTHAGASLYVRGSKSEAGLISTPLGYAICDEMDRCSTNTMALLMKRFSARENHFFMALSTPTIPEMGIDQLYRQGTQEHFMFQCPGCSRTIELLWPESVEVCGDHYQDEECSRSFLKCHKCQHKLPHGTKPEWLAGSNWEQTHKVQGHRSFHITQLYSPGMTAEKIVRESLKAQISEVDNIEFHNQVLAQTYVMSGAMLTPELVAICVGNHSKDDARPGDSSRMICMGVDPGAMLDLVINEYIFDSDPGKEPSLNSKAITLWEGRLAGDDWDGLGKLMAEWQIQHCCVDFQPETTQAKRFARQFPGHVSLVQYRQGTTGDEIKVSEDETGVPTLTVDRTTFLDISLGRVHKQRISFPRDVSGLFREHLQSPIRTYQINESDGRARATYVNRKDDHMAHALAFCEIALYRAYQRDTGRTIKVGESYFTP